MCQNINNEKKFKYFEFYYNYNSSKFMGCGQNSVQIEMYIYKCLYYIEFKYICINIKSIYINTKYIYINIKYVYV